MRRAVCLALAAALGLAACGPYDPIIDRGQAGFDDAAYQRDLAECRGYAAEIEPARQAVGGALLAAAAGAAFGAIIGSFDGNAGRGAGLGASVGGLGGGVRGGATAIDRQEEIVRRCLAGRGYAVLG